MDGTNASRGHIGRRLAALAAGHGRIGGGAKPATGSPSRPQAARRGRADADLGSAIHHFVSYQARQAQVNIHLHAKLLSAVVTAAGCSTSCGNISIPYPFGIEPDCYHDGFNLTCDYSYRPPKLFLGDGTVKVLEISIPSGMDNSTINACATYCPSLGNSDAQPQLIRYLLLHGECSGLGCCNRGIPKGYTSYHIQLQPSNDSSSDAKSSVYIAEEGSYNISKLMSEPRGVALPALLDWVISNSSCQKQNSVAPGCRSSNSFCQNYTSYVYNGYQCRCSAGYRGNPYILDGCQGTS
uniref:Wall-associated receptor kinase galacturonan-binding domain-containing protein n=1 Tax=Aegilops tauschii TaxID=37682 RepID=R7W320_AEGTA